MQAGVGVGECLSRTRRPPRTLLQLRLGQQGGGGCSLTDCMQAVEEDKRPCRGVGGTEQRRTVRTRHRRSPRPAAPSSPARRRGQGPLRDRLADCMGWRAVGSGTHTCGHAHTGQACKGLPAPPPNGALGSRALTFLHRDGGLLLPKPQQDEEEDQGDEDLEGQDPLERAGGVRPPAQGQERPAPPSLWADARPEDRPCPHTLLRGPQTVSLPHRAFQRARGAGLCGPREKQAPAPPGSCPARHAEGRQGRPASGQATPTPAGARLISPACRAWRGKPGSSPGTWASWEACAGVCEPPPPGPGPWPSPQAAGLGAAAQPSPAAAQRSEDGPRVATPGGALGGALPGPALSGKELRGPRVSVSPGQWKGSPAPPPLSAQGGWGKARGAPAQPFSPPGQTQTPEPPPGRLPRPGG